MKQTRQEPDPNLNSTTITSSATRGWVRSSHTKSSGGQGEGHRGEGPRGGGNLAKGHWGEGHWEESHLGDCRHLPIRRAVADPHVHPCVSGWLSISQGLALLGEIFAESHGPKTPVH